MVSKEDKAEAFPWWCDGSHYRRQQSHWLQATLSELNEKIKLMVSIIEEDGDSFAKRAEMFYKRRPQLIKALEELHKSYHWLAEKYDQLRKLNHNPNNIRISFSDPLMKLKSKPDDDDDQKQAESTTTTDHYGHGDHDSLLTSLELDKMWSAKEVSDLIEDHLSHQAELIRENEEKREKIKQLNSQIKRLMGDNGALRIRLATRKRNHFFGKLSGCTS